MRRVLGFARSKLGSCEILNQQPAFVCDMDRLERNRLAICNHLQHQLSQCRKYFGNRLFGSGKKYAVRIKDGTMLPVGVDEVPQFAPLREPVTDCRELITTPALGNKSTKSPTRICLDRKACCRAQTDNAGPPSTGGRRRNAQRLKVYRSMKIPCPGRYQLACVAFAATARACLRSTG